MDPTTNRTPPGDPQPPPADAPTSAGGRAGRGADEQVRAIARAVDRNARKTTELNDQVRRLADDLARLVALVTTPPLIPAPAPQPAPPTDRASAGGPAHRPDQGPGVDDDPDSGDGQEEDPWAVRSWLLASDPEHAVADLADLVEWLDRVYLRYPGTELGGCWLWHPHVIEELLWLRCAHADAYDTEHGSWLRVGDWHDRQRPGVVKRVREVLGKCDLSLHTPGRPHGHAATVAPLVEHAAQIAAQWATTSTRPEPTEAQIAEAADHAQAMHRRTR